VIDVLVVDDDFMVAGIHSRFVERLDGFRVVGSVGTGGAALAAVETDPPDVLLLDVHLPDISGLEVLRRIRAAGHDVDVVVITAAREADSVRAALHGGVAHYLVKPFEFDDLRVRLQQLREQRQRIGATAVADQVTIDALFGGPDTRSEHALPKGLSAETGRLVLACLDGCAQDVSATECAEAVGVSRVSARRYLEHYVDTGAASVRLRYGQAGRPERRYRPSRPG
jgi:response regulator of citrate/malate metabolism